MQGVFQVVTFGRQDGGATRRVGREPKVAALVAGQLGYVQAVSVL